MIQFVTTSSRDDSTNEISAAECQIANAIQNLVPDRFVGPSKFVIDHITFGIKDYEVFAS